MNSTLPPAHLRLSAALETIDLAHPGLDDSERAERAYALRDWWMSGGDEDQAADLAAEAATERAIEDRGYDEARFQEEMESRFVG